MRRTHSFLLFFISFEIFGGTATPTPPQEKCPGLVKRIGESLSANVGQQRVVGCSTPACFTAKEKLIQLRYDPAVAERIAVYRPDLYEMIISPSVQLTPQKLIVRPDIVSTFPRGGWFASQVQDRELVTVYRGIKGKGDIYDPTHYSAKPYIPEAGSASDPRIFTTDDISRVSRYPDSDTVILRMQIPRFLLYTQSGGPWGLVYFRDMVPNDLVFVSHVAFLQPGESKGTEPKFMPLEDALPKLPRAFLR